MTIKGPLTCRLVCQSRNSFEPTDWNELGILYSRLDSTLDGGIVILINTPGFDDTSKSDTDILKIIAALLATA